MKTIVPKSALVLTVLLSLVVQPRSVSAGPKKSRKAATKKSDAKLHKRFAVRLNGLVWKLLSKKNRTSRDEEVMVHAAHASCYHWLKVGTVTNHQRGEWLISRVYSVLGKAEAALRHARRCLELTQKNPGSMKDFDKAYAQEAMARAFAVSGRKKVAEAHRKSARKLGKAIQGKKNRRLFFSDLKSPPWK